MSVQRKSRPRGNVLILTQRLANNYGGLAQAFALQRTIGDLGYVAITNDSDRSVNRLRRLAGTVRSRVEGRIDSRERAEITREPRRFVSENIATVDLFGGRRTPRSKIVGHFDAFVVGSDQVWRAAYSDVPTHLLDFVGDDAKKIAYAASFGTSDLVDYTPALLAESRRLARRFDAISVREDSGVSLCWRYWGVHAEIMVDPTLLLDRSDYVDLVDRDRPNVTPSLGDMFSYILDTDEKCGEIVRRLSRELSFTPFSVLPRVPTSRAEYYRHPTEYRMPPVTQWIQGFFDAKFVVTDSFHGMVFSIIFNKPFVVVGNAQRGLARFTSLLKRLGLEDRLIASPDGLTPKLLSRTIDWDDVNAKIGSERTRGLQFLTQYLP